MVKLLPALPNFFSGCYSDAQGYIVAPLALENILVSHVDVLGQGRTKGETEFITLEAPCNDAIKTYEGSEAYPSTIYDSYC